MKKLVAHFDENEFLWLKRIITDRDQKEALAFIDKGLKPLVKEAERPSGLQRTFDTGGPPGQIGSPR